MANWDGVEAWRGGGVTGERAAVVDAAHLSRRGRGGGEWAKV